MSTTAAGEPTRGITAFEPQNGETSMKWEPNDEVVLNAALRNRLGGDIEVRSDAPRDARQDLLPQVSCSHLGLPLTYFSNIATNST